MHPAARALKVLQVKFKENAPREAERLGIIRADFFDEFAAKIKVKRKPFKEHFDELKRLTSNLTLREAIMAMLLQERDIQYIRETLKNSGMPVPTEDILHWFEYYFWDPSLLTTEEFDRVLESLPEQFDKEFLRAAYYHPSEVVLLDHGLLPPIDIGVLEKMVLSLAYKKLLDETQINSTKPTELIRLVQIFEKLKQKKASEEEELIKQLRNITISLQKVEDPKMEELKE